MSDSTSETYKVALPGTDQTQEYSRQGVLDALTRRELTPAHWVWSPKDSDWKQISEIPELQPKRSFLPPMTTSATVPMPVVPTAPTVLAGPAAVTPIRMQQAALPPIIAHVHEDVPKKKVKKVQPRRRRDDDGEKFPIFQVIFGVLFLAVAGLIGMNYELVDKPFNGKFAKSPFVLTSVHVHFGDLVHTGTVVIHVMSHPGVDEKNLGDFLFTMAKSAPTQPFGHKPFDTVTLTSGLTGQYVLKGEDWQQLGQMDDTSAEQRKNFVLDHVDDAAGHPLLAESKTMGDSELKRARTKAWQELANDLLP